MTTTRCTSLWLLLGSGIIVTIDRVEADQAVLEWTGGVRTPLPVVVLPDGIAEGDRLRVQWQRMPRATSPALPPQSPLPDFSEAPHPAGPTPPAQERPVASKEPPC